MPIPSPNSLAVIGGGPIGLETALAALDAGFDVHVFERGEVGDHPIAWGHVRMFTPWRMNVGPASLSHLEATGWRLPDPDALPTGLEFAENCLQPIAALPELADRVHTHAQVVHVSRHGALKGDLVGDAARAARPFRLLVRDAGGRENFIHAFALVDASGVYGNPNWAGDGGIPARQELYLQPQMAYHLEDVLGVRRPRYAGKRVMVIGSGYSAATVVTDLVTLAADAPGTSVVWVTRDPAAALYRGIADDPLPARAALDAAARELVSASNGVVTHVAGAVVEGFEYNSATHRYRVMLHVGEQPRREEVDHVVVNTGYGPDHSLYRELQVHECWATRGPMKLASALLAAAGAAGGDCTKLPAFGAELLANPEPNFWIVGNKSYGRNPGFLLEAGYAQVASVVGRLAAATESATP